MKISPKCRTKKLGMIYSISRSFCSFLIREGPIFGPKPGLGKSLRIFLYNLIEQNWARPLSAIFITDQNNLSPWVQGQSMTIGPLKQNV